MNIIYIQSTAGRPISWTTSSMNSSFLASFALCSRSWITDGERSFLATGFLIEICSCPDWKPLLSAFRGAARNYPRQNSSRTGNVLDAIFVRGWHAALVTKVATIYSRGEYAPDRVVRDTRKRSNSLILWSNKIYRNPLDPFETLGRWKSSIDRWIMILRFLFSLFTYDFFLNFSRLKCLAEVLHLLRDIIFVIGNIWTVTMHSRRTGSCKNICSMRTILEKYLENIQTYIHL